MFKSAATKIAHNTTIPALAGNSDLRPLQDLITAEKTVLVSLQRLRVDIVKACDALRIWGQGEGDDLGDILTASSMLLAHFATALSTYSSLHHTIRDSMKSIRTREEALDDLRRRRRRVGANAEAAEKKLKKMSPEHKNLSLQTDLLNKLREEMRAMDGEIVHDESELGDYKRKCTKDWMGYKFGGLYECCEKGMIVGDIGRRIIQCIPEDSTQPGLPRAHYTAHGHVSDLVAEAQRAVSQVAFLSVPSGVVPPSRPQPPTTQGPPEQTPFLPTPSLGSELTLGISTYPPPPGPPLSHTPAARCVSVDELGVQSSHLTSQFSSLPAANRDDAALASSSAGMTRPLHLSAPYDNGVAQSEENQLLMASIADAFSQSHGGSTLEESPIVGPHATDEPAPKYESIVPTLGRSAQSEPHGLVTNGYVGSHARTEEGEGNWTRKTTRRSTSPPSLPPGAAPAAITAWDDEMGQGEDGTHSDRPAPSSTGVPSQRPISFSDQDGADEDELVCDHDSKSSLFQEEEEGIGGDSKHTLDSSRETEVGAAVPTNDDESAASMQRSTSTASNLANATLLSRAGSQWRISRVPPPCVDAGEADIHEAPARRRENMYSLGTGARQDDETRTDETVDERACHAAAAKEVSRAMDELEFSATGPSSGYATPRATPPGYESPSSAQSQPVVSHPRTLPQPAPPPLGGTPYSSLPPSPNLPFTNRGRGGSSSMMDARQQYTPGKNVPGRWPSPMSTPAIAVSGGGPSSSTTAGPMSPMYRSSPEFPPPEFPRPSPPFSSPLMASSTSSLNGSGGSPEAPRTISAAAFRRQPHSRSVTDSSGPVDTGSLALRKSSASPSSSMSTSQQGTSLALAPSALSKAILSVVNPDPQMSDEEEVGNREGLEYADVNSGEGVGYGAGWYVSNLERH